jgi:hypothetical protein
MIHFRKMHYSAVSEGYNAGFLLIHRDIGEYLVSSLFRRGGKGPSFDHDSQLEGVYFLSFLGNCYHLRSNHRRLEISSESSTIFLTCPLLRPKFLNRPNVPIVPWGLNAPLEVALRAATPKTSFVTPSGAPKPRFDGHDIGGAWRWCARS